jgi:hypothetical protein
VFGAEAHIEQLSLLNELGDKALNYKHIEHIVKAKNIKELSTDQLKHIDALLDSVKICDPAIGSGAFPMGLLQEIFGIKEVISYQLDIPWQPATVKENIIQNSVYGVDIEKGAVDIARLRFWLSLIVDEDKPKALPNLDYKIVVGNSLISKFKDEIVDIDWNLINNSALKQSRPDLYKKFNYTTNLIIDKQKIYFNAEGVNKKEITNEIRNAKIDLLQILFEVERQKILEKGIQPDFAKRKKEAIVISERKLQYDNLLSVINSLSVLKENPERHFDHFDWKLDFPEILNPFVAGTNPGFDIVIGNPPYGAKMPKEDKDYCLKKFITAKSIKDIQKGSIDSYTLFLDLGFHICKLHANLFYIVPISVISSDSLTGLHKLLEKNCDIIKVASFSVRPQPVFENAVVNTSIFFFKRTNSPCQKLLTSKMFRKSKSFNLEGLLQNIEFVNAKDLTLPGRYPKISTEIEKNILNKLLVVETKITDLIIDNGSKIYYRTTGGRYFKVITNYSTGSTQEKFLQFDPSIANVIGAILSSNLFFWYYQIFSDNLHIKMSEIEYFSIPISK